MGRPASAAIRFSNFAADGVNRRMRRSAPRITMGTSTVFSKLFNSPAVWVSSRFRLCNSSFSVVNSSLEDCNSSLAVSNSSFVLWSSSLLERISSLAASALQKQLPGLQREHAGSPVWRPVLAPAVVSLWLVLNFLIYVQPCYVVSCQAPDDVDSGRAPRSPSLSLAGPRSVPLPHRLGLIRRRA